jgi:hypothetical protein
MQPTLVGESNRSSVMSVTWTISVGGRSYGPYSLEQMKVFQSEGRLAPHSLVVREGEEQMRYASEDGELAPLFPAPREQQTAATVRQAEPGPARFGRDNQSAGERTRYIIAAEMKSGSISALEDEISNFGASFRFLPQTWILVSELSLNAIRSELIQKLGKLDTLIVVDTTHDKAAWFNFGPEADTKMRRLWQREAAPTKTSA